MGIVKAISGHTGARGVMRHLERDGRALARDFLNIGAPIEGWEGDLPRYGACDWVAEMDAAPGGAEMDAAPGGAVRRHGGDAQDEGRRGARRRGSRGGGL